MRPSGRSAAWGPTRLHPRCPPAGGFRFRRSVMRTRQNPPAPSLRWFADRSIPMRAFLTTLFICLAAQAQNPSANLTVDVNANRRAIHPNIYGLAYASTAQLEDL